MLDCIQKGITSSDKVVILLICSALAGPRLDTHIQFWPLLYRKAVDRVKRRATKMITGLAT